MRGSEYNFPFPVTLDVSVWTHRHLSRWCWKSR